MQDMNTPLVALFPYSLAHSLTLHTCGERLLFSDCQYLTTYVMQVASEKDVQEKANIVFITNNWTGLVCIKG